MNYLRDVIRRLRAGESQRRIARDLHISRVTVHKYREVAKTHGWLKADQEMPDDTTITAVLGSNPQPPRAPSSLEPYAEIVQQLLVQKVEMTAIWQRLRDNYGYTGSYSSVRRFVAGSRSDAPEVFVRVHTAPGEEMQVDFGCVGKLFDPVTGRMRNAYAFAPTYHRFPLVQALFEPIFANVQFRSLGGIFREKAVFSGASRALRNVVSKTSEVYSLTLFSRMNVQCSI